MAPTSMSPSPNIGLQHADREWPSIFDSATCVRKGFCPITDIRNRSDVFESHSLYYEQHGSGPEKILFIMGYVFYCCMSQLFLTEHSALLDRLNSSSFAWNFQIEHFAKLPLYSSLVFDNRGVGQSGAPRGPYTYVVRL
jgi:hypothetical protein